MDALAVDSRRADALPAGRQAKSKDGPGEVGNDSDSEEGSTSGSSHGLGGGVFQFAYNVRRRG